MDKFTSVERSALGAVIYDGEIDCKKTGTATRRMINRYPELSWIADCEPEESLSREYDNYLIEDNDGHFYIAVITHKWQ